MIEQSGMKIGWVELNSDPAFGNCFLSYGGCNNVAGGETRPDPTLNSCQFLSSSNPCDGDFVFNLEQSAIDGASSAAALKKNPKRAQKVMRDKKEKKMKHLAMAKAMAANSEMAQLTCEQCTKASKAYWYDNNQFGGDSLFGCLDTLADCQFAGRAWASDGDTPMCATQPSDCPDRSGCNQCINVQNGVWCPQEKYCFTEKSACDQASKCTCETTCSD